MAEFGNRASGPFPLGLISVGAPGTPVGLDANVAITTFWGTPTGGVPGLTTKGVPSQLQANQIKVSAPSTNVGDVFLVFKAAGFNAGAGESVILVIPKGQERTLGAPAGSNPFQLDKYGIDAVNGGDGAYVTAVVCN